ncbi:zinc ABC transporter substrate-binding protein [Thioclava sp. FR2]|uniref:zinc ABC transporter substrate-binding protein n=1 Tax=Thioclava sp. FR2 TaxID=3445780 RepID=UPI003EB75C87
MRSIFALLLSSLAVPAFAEVPRVVTDIVPVHSLVAQIMEGAGTPELLLSSGADPHSFQMRPSQAAAVAEADLIVWIGPELTPWLDRALDGLAEAAPQLDLVHAQGIKLLRFEEPEGHDEEDDHGHSHDGTDPHVWLNVQNAVIWADQIAAKLAKLDAENAELYRANATEVQNRLKALDTELAETLAPFRERTFVVFHDSLGYFTDHYGLASALSVAGGDAATPGAAHLTELQAEIVAAGPICLFPEAQHDPALLLRVAEGTGAKLGAPLDPEGSFVTPGPTAYEAILRDITLALTTCLSQ